MRTLIILSATILVSLFASCDKGDLEVKKLNRGEGIWVIESVEKAYYDSTGINIDSTRLYENVGEFVFFQNTTLNALFDEHFVCVNLIDNLGNTQSYPGGVYYDDNRVKIATDAGIWLDGVWTVLDNGRRRQEWAIYALQANGELWQKWTMKIRKK